MACYDHHKFCIQVTQGISEFKPTPSENRDFCKKSYSVPHTLLVLPASSCFAFHIEKVLWLSLVHSQCCIFMLQVKFRLDAIDETDLLEDILKPRVDSLGGTLEKVMLAGNHLTPCAQVFVCTIGQDFTYIS